MFFELLVLNTLVHLAVLEYTFDTKTVDVPVDHFCPFDNRTFKLRYLVNSKSHVRGGPILVYTGNEANIEVFAKNTGFVFDIAPAINALVVFIEHRYYGQSMPFGNDSLKDAQAMKYLSTSQALADFVYVVDELKRIYLRGMISNDTYPFIALGGSYGGMLAAWLRMKYPTSVVGAIAASASIWYFSDQVPCEKFYEKVTEVFENYGGKECVDVIKNSWTIIRNASRLDKGRSTISTKWKLCSNISAGEVEKLVEWLSDIYVNLAMTNYPYPSEFMVRLPAFPVKVFCNKLYGIDANDSEVLLTEINKALQIYTNYTGNTKCHNIDPSLSDPSARAWDYQVCSELVMPICSTDNDMFENRGWDLKKYSEDCVKKIGVKPLRPDRIVLEYGGRNLRYYSNIVFSNGMMDPWSVGGVTENVSSTILAISIPRGAHHVDFRGNDLADDNFVVAARKFHLRAIKRFLNMT